MLDNLRGMAVFASVVDCGSFSGAAKSLGITTSAVSQQVRALENDIGIVLLHRSTRKISLTEAGESFYLSCQDVVNAARNGRYRLSALRDELTGQLRFSTTPELAESYLMPALDEWLESHPELGLNILTNVGNIDLIEDRIDIAMCIANSVDKARFNAYPLKTVKPLLVASPILLNDLKQKGVSIASPDNLTDVPFISLTSLENSAEFALTNVRSASRANVKLKAQVETNSIQLAKKLAVEGKGVLRVVDIHVQNELAIGDLEIVLPDWYQMSMQLFAIALKRDQHPAKVVRCIDLLQNYFGAKKDSNDLRNAS